MNVLFYIAVSSFIVALILFVFFLWHSRKKNDPFVTVKKENTVPQGKRGLARVCPICAAAFLNGETVFSKRFPSTGRFDRLLHIQGCKFCMNGERERLCPVCQNEMRAEDYLVARIYERPGKSHVHVQGCNNCCIKRH